MIDQTERRDRVCDVISKFFWRRRSERGPRLAIAMLLAVLCMAPAASAGEDRTLSVLEYGAAGDGKADDTDSINRTIEACAEAGGGKVVFPPGKYLSGTIHLKSNVALKFDAHSRLVGTAELKRYQHFTPPDGTHEARFRPAWHRGLILGIGVQNVSILGEGVIDGAKVFDPRGEERMRGPHTILLGDCEQVEIRGISIEDSANYAVMLEHCHDVDIRGIKVTGGWDAVHFRGWQDKPCRNISIVDCQFFTGDDCIAGRYWTNALIRNCVINSSCNGIRVIGPAEHLIIDDCLFYGPGRFEHRTSDRHNMLAGVILQPGAWDSTEGRLDNVWISNNTMRNVATPVQVALKTGNTAGEIIVERLNASGVYRAACSVESWTDDPIERFVLRDASIEYEGGGKRSEADSPLPKPGRDARRLPTWGFFGRNINQLVLENVRLSTANDDFRHAMIFSGVGQLAVNSVRLTVAGDEAAEPFVLDNVQDHTVADTPTFTGSNTKSERVKE